MGSRQGQPWGAGRSSIPQGPWHNATRRYKVLKQLGDGTYGSVWKAINRQTNEVVRATWVAGSCPVEPLLA